MKPKFRVAICGAGIGGLSFALGLSRYDDIEIHIYEAAEKFKEIGAGIGIWGRAITVLGRWGLDEKARRISSAPAEAENSENSGFEIRRSDQSPGRVIGAFVNQSINLGFHRSHLHDLIAEELRQRGRATFHFKKRCVSFSQQDDETDAVTIYFADGTSANSDVLVGSDGIKSAVRGHLLYGESEKGDLPDLPRAVREREHDWRRFVGTHFSGAVAYRALINAEELRAIDPHNILLTNPGRKLYTGKERHIVTYPVAGGRFINFVGLSSDPKRQEEWKSTTDWVCEAEHEELATYFHDFEPEASDLVKCVSKSSRWAMYDLDPLPFWSKGRVTLLGDAAHATTPFLGAGGGQVLEDGYILSSMLGSPIATRSSLAHVLKAYEAIRKESADRVILCSRESCRSLQFLEEYAGASDEVVGNSLNRMARWLWEDRQELDDDLTLALEMVEQAVVSDATVISEEN
ncbi:hypothetical protein M422DRAFT_240459 [Sphaerobolus stellatus SS14]|nr:hypothetical protein M422DRAFT_240459 [Sphaerobolus stellatus SS14]